jgi:putative phosphoribosyl transferase
MPLFEDRVDAAKQLAKRVEEWLEQRQKSTKNAAADDIIVLAIPRGGVVVGDVISNILGAKLDIIVSRKIGAPDNPELAIGAVMPDGSYFLNEDIVDMLNVPKYYITEQANIQKKEIERRLMAFRAKEDSDYSNNNDFEGKTVVLVDDGIATGATIISAAQWLETKQNCCKMLIVGVPVAPPSSPSPSPQSSSSEDIVSKLNQIADKVIILYRPEPFYAVGQFYRLFEQVSDNEVREIMQRHRYGSL